MQLVIENVIFVRLQSQQL